MNNMINFRPSLWQVGLDIQSDSLRAVAVQRRRHGWQLRHWWHHALPEESIGDKNLCFNRHLSKILQQLRQSLPRRFSLRIALPASQVLQHHLSPPTKLLDPQALDWYIKNQSRTKLSLTDQEVMVDYRRLNPESEKLCVMVVRKPDVEPWLNCLAEADLQPQVVETTPTVLRILARALAVPKQVLLLHVSHQQLLWVSPWEEALMFGVLPRIIGQEAVSVEVAYSTASGRHSREIGFSALSPFTPATAMRSLAPFTVIQILQPPLPQHSNSYALAVGLAIRTDDSEEGES